MSEISKRPIIRNLSFALLAQLVFLFASTAIQFIGPKFLDVEDFAYWQLFWFYISYVGISRLGISDGIYLRSGGKHRKDLDLGALKAEFIIYFIIQIFVAVAMALLAITFIEDKNRVYVLLACAVGLLVANYNSYFASIFQAINETNVSSISDIIYNALRLFSIIPLSLANTKSFKIIIVSYIIGTIISAIYLFYKSQFILRANAKWDKSIFVNLKNDILTGIPILISAYASMLIPGVARFVVDGHWGIEVFGYISFTLSLTTFILKFLSQISMVMFPVLCSVNEENRAKFFTLGGSLLSFIMPAILIIYVPLKFFINWWLPEYSTSLVFFGIMFPLCIFDSKMQLLYSTYFKVLQKPRHLLYVNIVAVIVSFAFSIISAYVLDNVTLIAWGLLLSFVIRSLISEALISKWLSSAPPKILTATELILLAGFSAMSMLMSDMSFFIIYLILYIAYLIINKNTFKESFSILRTKLA